ncbi:MAG: hypothetical protein RL621_132 [Bacteroidota bacterium]|jgi:hypothetical protein
MKILYIGTDVETPAHPLVDYQNDCLLIGLKELYGDDVVDVNRRKHLYADYPAELVPNNYGKGFTVTRCIEEDNADRTDIENKIKSKYFDYVVYGSVWRNTDYLKLVLDNYDRNKIAFVDGDDQTKFNHVVKHGTLYFKRELMYENNMEFEQYFGNVIAIGFAFPTKKLKFGEKKTQFMSQSIPGNPRTYVFDNEQDYYADYQKSQFGITKAKAGWDCLRHYEIMGNGCMPLFENIHECPRHIMMHVPKALLTKIMFWHVNDQKWLMREYNYYLDELQKYVVKFCTTEAVAKRFVSKLELYK